MVKSNKDIESPLELPPAKRKCWRRENGHQIGDVAMADLETREADLSIAESKTRPGANEVCTTTETKTCVDGRSPVTF